MKLRFAIMALMLALQTLAVSARVNPADSTICGSPEIDAERMYRFVLSRNPDFKREIAQAYYDVGCRYGIRGDIALCQAIIETGWFMFADGTAVTPDQHNYCGLGVTQLGMKGHSFDSIEEGVTAQIQHLFAYSSHGKLPKGEKVIDPRFHMVKRGVAPAWTDLNCRWAANDHYGQSILAMFDSLRNFILVEQVEIMLPEFF